MPRTSLGTGDTAVDRAVPSGKLWWVRPYKSCGDGKRKGPAQSPRELLSEEESKTQGNSINAQQR